MSKHFFIFGLLVVALSPTLASGQTTPWLEQQLTISFNDEPLESVLTTIASRAGFVFSYSQSVVEGDRRITRRFVNQTIRQILDELFDGNVVYKTRGQYVILSRVKKKPSTDEPVKVSGYIVDESTGQKLQNVTVYEPVTLASALTDSFGFFEMEISKPPADLKLAINRTNYSDTVLTIPRGQQKLLSIQMKVNREFSAITDSVGSKLKRFWSNTKLYRRQRVKMSNVRDTIYRKFQTSFVPFAGTNHGMSGNVINNYSLNVLGGYSMGNRKAELGGLFNIERGNVSGFQAAGLFNTVMGTVRGGQIGGVANWNGGTVEGVAIAGVVNFVQLGSNAVEIGGIANVTLGNQRKPHIAGVSNVTAGESESQVAGVINVATEKLRGAQVAGVINVASNGVIGTQVAGVVNVAAGKVMGAQVGVMNIANRVHGAQTGVFNFADSVSGVPFGLVSIVLKGYHKIELAADEVFHTNLAFRTGVRQFYNIMTAGIKPGTLSDPATFWTFGYGLGTAPALSRSVFLNFDFTSNQIIEGNYLRDLNLLNKAYIGLDVQLSRKVSLTAGGTVNMYLTDPRRDDYWPLFSGNEPPYLVDRSVNNAVHMRIWLGAKAGIRFL